MSKKLNKITWALILFQLVFWTLIPLFAHHAPPLDVTEMHGWAMTFQWGFYKHPPMPTWIIAITQAIVGKNMLSLFIPASLSIAATYYCVAWLAGKILPEKEAIVALFLYALTIFCNLWSTDFNHNQIQMPFWALSLVVLYLTLSRGSLSLSFLLGAVMGLNALSKYTASLIVPCALFLLVYSPKWREKFTFKMLLLATAGFLIVFGPHVQWLLENDFLPFRYLGDRFEQLDRETNVYLNLLNYIANILLAHVLMILGSLYLLVRYRKSESSSSDFVMSPENKSFLWVMGVGPVLITLLLGVGGVQLYTRWVTPMLPMISILVVYLLGNRVKHFANRKAFVVFLLLELTMGFGYIYKDRINTEKSSRGSYPAPEITAALYQHWHDRFPNQPLRIVSGGEWEAGFVSLFSPEKTYVYTEANSKLAPWITEHDANLCGMIMVAPTDEERQRFLKAEVQEPIVIKQPERNRTVTMSWAILPPQGDCPLN